jgi:protein O-GlcNAc transferase
MQPPPSRIAPCPCGSGKRYKECHGALSPPSAVATDGVATPAQAALGRGRPAEALALLRQALARSPEDPSLLLECARVEWMTGDTSGATAHCRAALDRAPSDVAAWNFMGEIERATDPDAAEEAWRRTLSLAPDNAEALFHLGNLCRERGDPQAARRHYERALESTPGHPGVLNNLGLALEASGERERAIACYREILAANPAHADALGNLANLTFEREDHVGASALYERLFAIRRDVPASIWVRRALVHQRLGDVATAEAYFREAARLDPDDARIQQNLGTILHEQKRYADADPAWLRALAIRPDNPYALSMLAHGRAHRCDWRDIAAMHATINRLLESDALDGEDRINPFALLAMPTSPTAQLRAAQRWARGVAPGLHTARPADPSVPGERLRVGFVSSDLRAHPMVALSVEFWEGIDRDRIETFAYGIRERDPGPIGRRAEAAFEHFADVSQLPDEAIARRIRDDRIAIVVDLNGYTLHSRDRIFALRPAPIQINYLGFPGTLGAQWYDYIWVDPFGAPPSMQPYFTERLLTLPNMNFPGSVGRAPKGPPPGRAECGLPENAFVFCCFNSAFKILPDVFGAWMRLLDAVPRSVLWLLDPGTDAIANLRREASGAGIDPNRLIFAPRIDSVERHVARTAAADLIVDSFPYGAHTTANDALLAGVPLITRAGETLVSRIAGSHLHAIGLPELVTSTPADYEALARRLAQSPPELAAIRGRLAANRYTHPLFDVPRFTQDVEASLFSVWRAFKEAPPGNL